MNIVQECEKLKGNLLGSPDIDPQLLNLGDEIDLNKALELKPKLPDKDMQRYYKFFLLLKLYEKNPKDIFDLKVFKTALNDIESYAYDFISDIFILCNSILLSEINQATESNEKIKWIEEAYTLKIKTGLELSSLHLGYIYLSEFTLAQAEMINYNSSIKDISSVLDNLAKVQRLGCDIYTGLIRVGNFCINYIERINDFYGVYQSQEPKRIKESYFILDRLTAIIINDEILNEAIQKTEEALNSIEPRSLQDTPNKKNLETLNPESIKRDEAPLQRNSKSGYPIYIYKAKLKPENKNVLLKIYEFQNTENFSSASREVDIYERLSQLSSFKNSFLKYYGTFINGTTVNLVMELYPQSLFEKIDLLKNVTDFEFEERALTDIYMCLINSFAQMEEMKIFHRDIKCGNLVVDENWNIKIIDFDLAYQYIEETTERSGTPHYRAPEIEELIRLEDFTTKIKIGKADVFSLGIVFLEIVLHKFIRDLNTNEKNAELLNIVETEIRFDWAKNLLKAMLNKNPNERPSFKDLKSFMSLAPRTDTVVSSIR
jgi:Protein kinase domain